MNSSAQTNKSLVSNNVHALVVFFIFVLLSVLAFAFREAEVLLMIADGEVIMSSEYTSRAEICLSLPVCLRVVDAWMGWLMEWILIESSRLLDLLPHRVVPERLSLAVKESYLIIMAGMLTRILSMLPMVLGAFVAYRNLALRLLLILAAFMSIFGWARSNLLFSEMGMGPMDYTAIGFVFLLFALMAQGHTRSFVKASLALLCGQMILENLGILTGVAVVFHDFMVDRESHTAAARWRSALRRLAGFAAVSLLAIIIVYYLRVQFQPSNEPVRHAAGFFAYFQWYWEHWGRANFADFYDIMENFVEILAYPSVAGILIGLLAAFGFPGEEKDAAAVGHQFWAILGMWIGFLCTLFIAMFVSGLYYEMGRQLLPLCVITTLAWAKGIELLVAHCKLRAVV